VTDLGDRGLFARLELCPSKSMQRIVGRLSISSFERRVRMISSSSAIDVPSMLAKLDAKSAVCFDVDSTVITEEVISYCVTRRALT